MYFIVFGSFISSKDLQFIKHIAGIFVKPSGICNGLAASEMHSAKQ